MKIIYDGYNKLKNAYETAAGYQRLCAKIKAKLNILQEKETNEDKRRRYEIRKKMWANLQTRLYKETYLISKFIIPKYIEMFNFEQDELKRKEIKIDYDKENEDEMKKVYAMIFNETNKRIYDLRDTAVKMIQEFEDKTIKKELKKTLEVFDKNVIECVGNCLYQHYTVIENLKGNKDAFINKVKEVKSLKDVDKINI